MDESEGGRASSTACSLPSSEGIEDHLLLTLFGEPRREALSLQLEHRLVATAVRDQLVVGPKLDDSPVLEHADAIGVAHRREPVGDENRRAVAGRGENPIEDLGLA